LEVRVGFKGTLVWPVDPGEPDLTQAQPELQGEYKEPRLVCSADVMHPTGFGLKNGEIAPDRGFEDRKD